MTKKTGWLKLLAVWLLAAFLAGCGVKTPPTPVRSLLPGPVTNLGYRFAETGELVIRFQAPAKDILTRPLKSLGGFYIERSENKLAPGFCPGCPVRYTSRLDMDAKTPEKPGEVWDGTYEYKDRLNAGHVYHFRVTAHDQNGRLDEAQGRSLVVYYDSPARPPDGIKVATDDRLVVLSWPPPEKLVDGRPITDLAGYNIYRAESPEGPWLLLNADQPWGRIVFEDRLVLNRHTYYYKLRPMRVWRGTQIEGPPTETVSATPIDLTPPPPPVTLEGVSLPQGVKLIWSGAPAPDLAGYRVYRREEQEEGFSLLTEEIIIAPTYLDQKVVRGRLYHYQVRAVDRSENMNESEPTRVVTVRFTP